MNKKLIWKGTKKEARKHPLYHLAIDDVQKIIDKLEETKIINSMCVIIQKEELKKQLNELK